MSEQLIFSGKRMTFTAHTSGCEGALCHPDAALADLTHKFKLQHPHLDFSQAKEHVMARNPVVTDAYYEHYDLLPSEQPSSAEQKATPVEGDARADEKLAALVEKEMAATGATRQVALLEVKRRHPGLYSDYLGQFS